MLRSEEMIDELVATLHFHHYLQMGSSNIFGGGSLNIVANDHKIDNIQGYIDDLYIDLFFRTHKFKPIRIPKDWTVQRYTKEGEKICNGGIELNLNCPFDRYTFVDFVSNTILNRWGHLSEMFPQNRFFVDVLVLPKVLGPIWTYPDVIFRMPDGGEFEQYLNYLYGMKHSKYNPLFRAQDIIEYSQFYQSEKFPCYEGLGNNSLYLLHKRQCGYKEIKNLDLFGEYTLEDILMIYCLLVCKFKMKEESFLSFIGLFANEKSISFLNEFREFEFQTTNIESIKPFVRDRDLFLRFTSAKNSKAVKFTFLGNAKAEIQFFNDNPVQTICRNNSLPLPFLYSELY